MYTIVITVENDGRLGDHHIYNQEAPWSVEQAREWFDKNSWDPDKFVSVKSEPCADRD